MILNNVEFTWGALLIIPLILELFVFALSIAFLLSALYVRFRDVNYIWEVVLQAGFYATPIIYPLQLVVVKSTVAAQLLILNPVAQIIQDARFFVVTGDTIRISNLHDNPFIYLVPLGSIAILAVVSVMYFRKKSPNFAEEI